jgi:hypothetical protein
MAGRPSTKKEVVENIVETKETDISKVLEEKDKELSAMKDMMLQMQAQMQQMMSAQLNAQPQATIQQDEYMNIYKSIPVMSLFDGQLNLSTQPHGQGKPYTFTKYGEVRNIVYNDLRDIIGAHFEFAKKGLFYVMDTKIVSENGLSDYYETILTKEQIDGLIDTDKENILNLFTSASNSQKEVIVDLIVGKMARGIEFDLNKVDVISTTANMDLKTMAKDLKFALGEKI